MTTFSRSLLLSAILLAAPLTGAFAQPNNPAGNYGSNRSETATPGTADSKAASGVNTGDVGSHGATSNYAGTNPTTPGATGRTVVPGTTSTQSGDAAATAKTQTGGTAGGK
jgi:hypothetical protein